ncbi:trypsin-like serine peptidase [Fodinicola acaciae]|uniref:trypsin-like serine peptidase n=1 Tax=Fodinicola acaciae TaxID=2681555 RepID=UPI0013D08CB5|nr:peptidase [Fodinicola acaciae]
MLRRHWRSGAVLAASTLVACGLFAPAPASADSGIAHPQAVTNAQAEKVSAYWTPARMRAAIPMDQLLARTTKKISGKVAAGRPATVRPTAVGGVVQPQAFPSGGGAWTGGGAVVHTAGRVFFVYNDAGTPRNASCSGNAVTSGNKSVVITAGHCVKLGGNFHTKWTFVPAYNNGNAPYGTWSARATMSTPQWVASEDINYDVGAAVVNQLNGKSLTDVVGGQGVAFNQAKNAAMYAFGWPAADPYDGTKMIYCSGNTFNALISDGIGMTCDMTGGASGGPWFRSFNESTGTGLLNSVNSYKINLVSIWMFGPYFGADAQNLYNKAQAA